MRCTKLIPTVLVVLAAPMAHAQTVYSNDFSTTAGSEWTNSTISTSNGEKFLATATNGSGNGTNTLTLLGLPAHTAVTVDFDLYIIQSWDGNGPGGGGPDRWGLTANAASLLNTTFANFTGGNTQEFVSQANPNGGPVAPRTGQFAANHLGFGTTDFGDATYRFSYTFNDTASNLALAFTSFQNQTPGDEGWGLDNVTVRLTPAATTPEPGTFALLGSLSVMGAGFLKRRRK